MPSKVLEDVYKLRSSEYTIPQLMDIIYQKEKDALSESTGSFNLKNSIAIVCLRDLKEWLYRSEQLHINTYAFRKKIDEIKSERGYVCEIEDVAPIDLSKLSEAREILEIGIDSYSGSEAEIFRTLYNIFFMGS